ncbi:MAG TPA: Uma2 family endonuclease [Candidatus Eisenbacteria bacterium]|jgi:Uma2 family endonuclease|nr:Uma2 family endonuclease [Candidatus Eisenbacteria bacterium]
MAMEATLTSEFISVDEYLGGEKLAEVRHEFVAGHVFAMAGASEEHNFIAGNIFAALHAHLQGKSWRVFLAEMKARLLVSETDIFYYPDVMVACDPRDTDRYFKRFPKVLIEVLSPDTERTDRREKFLSYTQIETLEEYVLVAQDRMEVTVFRRSNKWQPEVAHQSEEQLRLTSLDFALPLSEIYAGVKI